MSSSSSLQWCALAWPPRPSRHCCWSRGTKRRFSLWSWCLQVAGACWPPCWSQHALQHSVCACNLGACPGWRTHTTPAPPHALPGSAHTTVRCGTALAHPACSACAPARAPAAPDCAPRFDELLGACASTIAELPDGLISTETRIPADALTKAAATINPEPACCEALRGWFNQDNQERWMGAELHQART